jgi:hypothetical protein
MKTRFFAISSLVSMALFLALNLNAQESPADSTGLPGDNFSLEAALDLFKKAGSPEEFEKLLNSENNVVNNLDLNQDGQTDYIRVVDNMDGDAHAIVLQVPVSETESQDIAVIEIEKTGSEEATLQITGDEDLFGKEVIAEPYDEAVNKSGKGGPARVQAPVAIFVNVWGWPCVRFVYAPVYRVYVSPWRWRAYPTWWSPWRPHPYGWYHAQVRPYHAHYHVVATRRVVHAHAVYAPHRMYSPVVHTRTTTVVTRRNGSVEHSRSNTHVNGPRGGHANQHTKSTTVTGPRGNSVSHEKTTTTRTGPRGGTVKQQKTTTTTKHRGNGRH